MKDKAPPVVRPTASDTISKIIDAVKGRYRVLVTKDSLDTYGPPIIDTMGFDTIEVMKAEGDSISVLNYTMAVCDNQILGGTWFCFFSNLEGSVFPGITQRAIFFLVNDSIELRDGYGGFEWGTYVFYRGKKLSP